MGSDLASVSKIRNYWKEDRKENKQTDLISKLSLCGNTIKALRRAELGSSKGTWALASEIEPEDVGSPFGVTAVNSHICSSKSSAFVVLKHKKDF